MPVIQVSEERDPRLEDYRHVPDPELLRRSLEWIRASRSPVIVAGGGVHYSEANAALARFAELTGIPVVETWDLSPDPLGLLGNHNLFACIVFAQVVNNDVCCF